MNKSDVRAFFDRLAPGWDADQKLTPEKARRILDAAGVGEGSVVLDVGCGTGVMFPYYVNRNVKQVLAVDLSPEMILAARRKDPDPRIRLICADVEELPATQTCDAAILFNCFPHFPDPERLFERLSRWLRPGGRIAVAHDLGLKRLNGHHFAEAPLVSRCHISEQDICRQMEPFFVPESLCSEEDYFCITGIKRQVPAE